MTEMATDFIETQINNQFACKVIKQRNKNTLQFDDFLLSLYRRREEEPRANNNKTEILFFIYSANQHAIDDFKLIVEIHVLASETFTTINLSFESGEFACDWKEALLKPLLKKCGLDIAFHNFRPVSNLPYVAKLSEKAAANQLIDHMTTNDLHMPLQSAYKQNHSTESALLKVKNDILLNMEAQKVTLLVLLDLSAAFDTVRHDTLLNRLKSRFGVDGKALEWFASYLADRTQRVTVNDGLSSAFPLRKGVPQGSCLGPLLFTVYTSKLFDIVSKHLPSVHCYADDTQLYLAIQS